VPVSHQIKCEDRMSVMKERLIAFMYGRYGQDNLNRFLSIAALILMVVSIFAKITILNSLALVLMILSLFRMFSKNISKRSRENSGYLRIKWKITSWYSIRKGKFTKWKTLKKRKFDERKTHCYYKCHSCHVQLRVPKGRGDITITCPKCHASFKKKT